MRQPISGPATKVLAYWVKSRVSIGEAQTDQGSPYGKGADHVHKSTESNLSYCNMLSTSYKSKLCALVINEVHCVKTWGDNFRLAFAKIGDMRSPVE